MTAPDFCAASQWNPPSAVKIRIMGEAWLHKITVLMRGSGVGFHYVPRRHHFLREDITMAAGGAAELLLGMNCSFSVYI